MTEIVKAPGTDIPVLNRNDASTRAGRNMILTLVNYVPCGGLTLNTLKYISEITEQLVHEALLAVDEKEGRGKT